MGWGQRVDEKGRQAARLWKSLTDKQKNLDFPMQALEAIRAGHDLNDLPFWEIPQG